MMKYSAFNLIIQSDFPLPLPECQSPIPPDITVRIGEIEEPKNLSRTYDGVWYAHGGDWLFLKWDVLGSFLILEGQRIILSPSQNPASPSPVTPLLGAVMAVTMHQRGSLALHGSSVLADDKAIIFVGPKGAGKSTMAGYYRDRGHTLISDDVCAIDMQNPDRLCIHPSFPIIKLWPDSMQALKFEPEKHERVHPEFEKRNIRLDSGFSNVMEKVASIIILKTGPVIAFEPLTGHQTLAAILPHLIINRFADQQPIFLKNKVFSLTTKLVSTIPVYQLQRPKEIEQLPSLYELVNKSI